MILFNSDYLEGTHPRILEKLISTNFEQTVGYGEDPYSDQARDLIRSSAQAPEADVHFFTGGTQANLTVISAALKPYQGVISADSGHINIHETGAIEATGHRVLSQSAKDGKLSVKQIENCYLAHVQDDNHEHMVQPAMVYISHPTEIGTLYSKEELTAISLICQKYGLYLFLDGARLGYGLAASETDLTLSDIAALCDVFYIGGTKVGALFGEALIITCPSLKKDFRYMIKQKGGLLAKGRLLGLQFLVLFEDDLYLEISRHAIKMAQKLRDALLQKSYCMLVHSVTNQQFPILTNEEIETLRVKYGFAIWEHIDENHTAVRFCTSWATKEEHVDELIKDLESLR